MAELGICETPAILKVVYFVKLLINIVKIVVPLILITMVTIDCAKGVVTGEEKVGKVLKVNFNKILAAILIFTVPTIINIFLEILDEKTGYESCWANAKSDTIAELEEKQENIEKKLYCWQCNDNPGLYHWGNYAPSNPKCHAGWHTLLNKTESECPSNNDSNNSGNDTGNNSGNDTSNNSGNDAGNNSGNDTSNNSGNDAGNNSGNDTSNNNGNDAGNNSDNNTGNSGDSDSNSGSSNDNVVTIKKKYFNYQYFDDGSTMSYAFFSPNTGNKAGSKSKPKPLIVWLHGSGEYAYKADEEDFRKSGLLNVLMNWNLSGFDAYVLCPHSNKAWNDENAKTEFYKLLNKIIAERNINTKKIILMGHSVGGSATMQMLCGNESKFSAVVAISPAKWIYNASCSISSLVKAVPFRVYVGDGKDGRDYNPYDYVQKNFVGVLDSSNIFILETGHSNTPKKTLTMDKDGNKKSDVIEWALAQ